MFKLSETPWYRRLWYKDSGILAWLFCHLGLHSWRYDCNGWTNEEFESCGRCLKRGKEWVQ